jgi:hypothetical protein
MGAGFGFGMSFWTLRAVRRTADRYLPPGLVERVERALDALDGGTGGRAGVQGGVRADRVDRLVASAPVAPSAIDGDRAARSALRARVSGHPAAAGLRALAGGIGTTLPSVRGGVLSELDRGSRERDGR